MKKAILISILSGILSICLSLENTFPIVTIGYNFMNNAKFEDPYGEDDDWGGASLGMKTVDVELAYPVFFNRNRTYFIPSVDYTYLLPYYKDEPDNADPDPLHDIQIVLRLHQKLGKSFQIKAQAAPGASSDFKDGVASDDFVLRGGLTINWKMNDNLQFEGGALYDTPFGKQEIIPVLGATYHKNRLTMSALLPLQVDIHWVWNREMTVGLLGATSGHRFNLQNRETSDDDGSRVQDSQTLDYLEYSRVDLGPIIYWNIFDHFWFDIHSGMTFRKTFRMFDTHEKEMHEGDFSSEPSWFLSITTRYRIPLPE